MTFNINSINCNPGNQIFFAKKTLTSAQVQGMFASPVLFDSIPAPSATQAIVARNWGFNLNFNTTAYSGGGPVGIYYDTGRTQAATATLGVANITSTQSVCPQSTGMSSIISAANSVGKPLYISNATAALTSGDSTVTFYVWYSVVNFDTTFIVNAVNMNSNATTFQVAELYIPSSQVQTLNGTPITIVPAPGSGLMLVPERMISLLIYPASGGVAYNASTVTLIYGTSGTQIISNLSNLISGTASQYNNTTLSSSYNNFTPSNGNNNSLQIKASANPGSSGNSALKIYLSYSTITL